jgi:hypothetical protein
VEISMLFNGIGGMWSIKISLGLLGEDLLFLDSTSKLLFYPE